MTFLDQLATEGYVVVDDVLDPETDLAPLLDEYNSVLDGIASSLVDEGVLQSTHADLSFAERLIAVCQESGKNFPQHFDFTLPQKGITPTTPIHAGPAVFRVLTASRLLDLVEQVVGGEIYSNPVQHVRMKLPGRAVETGLVHSLVTSVPWHQDNGVIMPEADEATILTVWMPVTPATVENGCLQVIPRSHRGELQPHCPGKSTVAIPDRFLAAEDAVPLPMTPGSVLLMHQRTIHSSLENVTDDQVRISLDLRYQPIGQATGRPAFASAGFVARSRAHPEQVLKDAVVWERNWIDLRDRLAAEENPTFNRWSADSPVCA
jgi:ectoine hydroxylase-related dioxygenase (phytanoyl-CoA dioxygenase family)